MGQPPLQRTMQGGMALMAVRMHAAFRSQHLAATHAIEEKQLRMQLTHLEGSRAALQKHCDALQEQQQLQHATMSEVAINNGSNTSVSVASLSTRV